MKTTDKQYRRATADNGFLVSMGGGILPWPTREQFEELGGDVWPSWEHQLTRINST